MQASSPPVITPNRSQSNPDGMITLPRPIQSVGMDLHDVSGTSTGQTLPRERRAPPTFVRRGADHTRSAAAAARILRPGPQDPNARRRNHLRMVRGGAQTHTRSAAVTDV